MTLGQAEWGRVDGGCSGCRWVVCSAQEDVALGRGLGYGTGRIRWLGI